MIRRVLIAIAALAAGVVTTVAAGTAAIVVLDARAEAARRARIPGDR